MLTTPCQIRTARGDSHCLQICESVCMAALLCPAQGACLDVCEHLQRPVAEYRRLSGLVSLMLLLLHAAVVAAPS